MLWIQMSDIETIMKTTRPTRCTSAKVLSTNFLTKGLWFPGNWKKTKRKKRIQNNFFRDGGVVVTEPVIY